MYKTSNVVVDGKRKTNIFNSQDANWHAEMISPIRNIWGMTKILDEEPHVDEVISNLVDKFTNKYVNSHQVCLIEDWMTYCEPTPFSDLSTINAYNTVAWDTAANVSFGQQYGFINEQRDVHDFFKDMSSGTRYFAPISQIPWADEFQDKNPIIRIGPRSFTLGLYYSINLVTQYLSQQNKPQDPAPTKPNSAPAVLDRCYDIMKKDPSIDTEKLVLWILAPILAGGDTTACTLRVIAYYLCKTPHARKALTAEFDNASLNISINRPAQWKDIRDLPYLDAVIRESLRINPGVAMILERVVPDSGFTLPDGRFVPGGGDYYGRQSVRDRPRHERFRRRR